MDARLREATFKRHYGEPPAPRQKYDGCKNGRKLLNELMHAAGRESWLAGYVEAVFSVGERLDLLFTQQFEPVWQKVGRPPGPWASIVSARRGVELG